MGVDSTTLDANAAMRAERRGRPSPPVNGVPPRHPENELGSVPAPRLGLWLPVVPSAPQPLALLKSRRPAPTAPKESLNLTTTWPWGWRVSLCATTNACRSFMPSGRSDSLTAARLISATVSDPIARLRCPGSPVAAVTRGDRLRRGGPGTVPYVRLDPRPQLRDGQRPDLVHGPPRDHGLLEPLVQRQRRPLRARGIQRCETRAVAETAPAKAVTVAFQLAVAVTRSGPVHRRSHRRVAQGPRERRSFGQVAVGIPRLRPLTLRSEVSQFVLDTLVLKRGVEAGGHRNLYRIKEGKKIAKIPQLQHHFPPEVIRTFSSWRWLVCQVP